jgi:hypothetical protein
MTKLNADDWKHRLELLRTWHSWRDYAREPDTVPAFDNENGNDGRRNTYNAVVDACAITVRALCEVLELKAVFTTLEKKQQFAQGDRHGALMACCCQKKSGFRLIQQLGDKNEQLCLLEVLFLGNRAVAHPCDGGLDHKVGPVEMTSAINTLLRWLQTEESTKVQISAVKAERPGLLEPIPMPKA